MSQVAALHGPKRRVLAVASISLAQARKDGYRGPRFQLHLECGHKPWRYLVREADEVKCGECLGPDFTARGFKRDPKMTDPG